MPNAHYLDLDYPKMSKIDKAWTYLVNTDQNLKEISRKTGFSIRQLSKYRNNFDDFKHIAKYTLVEKLANLFEVDYATQLGGDKLQGKFDFDFITAQFQLYNATLELPKKYPYDLFYAICKAHGLSATKIDRLHIFGSHEAGNPSAMINAAQEMLRDPIKKKIIIKKVAAQLKSEDFSTDDTVKLNQALEEFKEAPIAEREMMYLYCEQAFKDSYNQNEAMEAYVFHKISESLKKTEKVVPRLPKCNIWQVDRKDYDLAMKDLRIKAKKIDEDARKFVKSKPSLTHDEADKFVSNYPDAIVVIDKKYQLKLKPSFEFEAGISSLLEEKAQQTDDVINQSLLIIGVRSTVVSENEIEDQGCDMANDLIASDDFDSLFKQYARRIGRYCGFNL